MTEHKPQPVHKFIDQVFAKTSPKTGFCDGAGRLELRPPVESSDLDEKVLTTTPLRDTNLLRIVNIASITYFPPYGERRATPAWTGGTGVGGRGWLKSLKLKML